jgi:Domain of unknown function (DUF1707)
MDDPGRLRISDDDRNAVAEVLRRAAGEGRIDLGELDERLEAAYHAKTYGELVPITADLPVAPLPQPVPHPAPATRPTLPTTTPAGSRHTASIAVMSESRRVGRWTVEGSYSAFALMGSVVLDLREAAFATAEVVINATAVMGEVRIVVDAGTTVVVEGIGVMGEYSESRAKVRYDPAPGAPVVRVRGLALMGSVHVQRKQRPDRNGGIRRALRG